MGNPTKFTEELFERMLSLHAGEESGEPMTIEDICRMPGMPPTRTFYGWFDYWPELEPRFRAARKVAMDGVASRMRRTARGKDPEHGGDSTNDVQRDKLIVDLDLKLLAKWDTARYGDRVQTEHSGQVSIAWPLAKPKIEP